MRLPLPRVPDVRPRPLVRAALAARTALLRAAAALVPPQYTLFDLGAGVVRTALLHVAARLRVADLLEEGPLHAAALARRSGTDADALHRALRALAMDGVFELLPDGRFRNNALSLALRGRERGSMRDFLEYLGSSPNMRAFSELQGTVETGKNAFERANGTHVWDWFAAHPEEGRTFAAGMSRTTELDAPAIAAGYPFGRFERICDVAGGRGTLLAEILLRHPGTSGVLVDAPYVLDEARAYLGSRAVGGRVSLVPGDLFGELPAGAGAYLLKDVLHDWDDEACGRILAGCRRALGANGRLLAVEVLVEPNDTGVPGPMLDVLMMTLCREGRQRSRAEWARLLARAGLRLERVVPLASPFSLVEAAPVA